MKSSLS
jgi:hypothetical protein